VLHALDFGVQSSGILRLVFNLLTVDANGLLQLLDYLSVEFILIQLLDCHAVQSILTLVIQLLNLCQESSTGLILE